MKWLPDNDRIILANLDKTVEIWHVSNQKPLFIRHFQGRNDGAQMVVLSPNGSQAASLLVDQIVEVWDMTSGSRICAYRGHHDQVNVIAWSPNGKYLASGSQDGTVHVWSAETGHYIFTYRGHAGSVHVIA
jgi:WD40 repeat protein